MEPEPVPEFRVAPRRVYDADGVDRYIEKLHDDIAQLRAELAQRAKVPTTEAAEALLGRALLNAQRTADQFVEEAEGRAREIEADARQVADRLIAEANRDAEEIIENAGGNANGRHAPAPTATSAYWPRETGAPSSIREAEAQRIVDDAHRKIDAIFASARRRVTVEHPSRDREPSERHHEPSQHDAWAPPAAEDAMTDGVLLHAGDAQIVELHPMQQPPQPRAIPTPALPPTPAAEMTAYPRPGGWESAIATLRDRWRRGIAKYR
jgi:cell division septum initiation protein DivIVA